MFWEWDGREEKLAYPFVLSDDRHLDFIDGIRSEFSLVIIK